MPSPAPDETNPAFTLGERFADAVGYASSLHGDQSRKDTDIPYVAHLLGAASLVVEQPGADEDEAIAALLHDSIEDQRERTSLEAIEARFGSKVSRIVADCTDADRDPKPPWRHRKEGYLAHLAHAWIPTLRVSLADKLHNATSIAEDHALIGDELWSRFNAPPVAQRWYYTSLAELLHRRLDNAVSARMVRTVQRFTGGLPAEVALPPMLERPTWVASDRVTGQADALSSVHTSGLDVGGWSEVAPGLAWVSGDGRWWVERVDNGNPRRPLTVFVAPAAATPSSSDGQPVA